MSEDTVGVSKDPDMQSLGGKIKAVGIPGSFEQGRDIILFIFQF